MRRTRRALALTMGVAATGGVALPLGLAACTAGAGAPVPAQPPAGPVAGQATVRFTYWAPPETPDEVELQGRVIAAFTERQPRIRVENVGVGAATGPYHEKLLAQAAAGTSDDVARVQGVELPRLARAGLLLALDDLLRRERFPLDDFFPAALPPSQFHERRYVLPVLGSPWPLFWSPKLFRESDLPAPGALDARGAWTWDAFLDAARRLTRHGGEDGAGPPRVGGFAVDLTLTGIGPFLWSAGGDYYDARLTRSTLTAPAAAGAVQFLVDLIRRHRVWPAPAEGAAGPQWFPGATLAMQVLHTTFTSQWRRDPAFEFDVVANPRGPAGAVGRLAVNGYGLLAGSPAPEAAWLFLQHLAGPETMAFLAGQGRLFPWRRSVAHGRAYREAQPIRSLDVLLALAERGRSAPPVPSWPALERFANPVLQALGDGRLAVGDGLERLRAEADRLLVADS